MSFTISASPHAFRDLAFLLLALPAKLHAALVKALAETEVRERFAAQGAEAVVGPPEQLAAALPNDVLKWGNVVKAAGIKID